MKIYHFLFLFLLLTLLQTKIHGQGFTRVYITKSEMLMNGCHYGDETGKIALFVDTETTPLLTFSHTTGKDNWDWLITTEYRYTNIFKRVFTLKLSGENVGCSGSGLEASVPVNVSTPTIIPLKKNTNYDKFGSKTESGRDRGYYLHYQTCFFPEKPQLKITSSSGATLSGSSIKVMPSEKLTLSATTADMNNIPVGSNNLRYEYYYSEYGTWEEENPDWRNWKHDYDMVRSRMDACITGYNNGTGYSYDNNFQCDCFSTSMYGKIESDIIIDHLTRRLMECSRENLYYNFLYHSHIEPPKILTKTDYKNWRIMSNNVFDCSTTTASNIKFKVRLQGADEFIDSNDSPIFTIEKPELKAIQTSSCFDENITLSVTTNYSIVSNPITYNYQYRTANGSWKSLTSSPSSTYTFQTQSLSDLNNYVGLVYFKVGIANKESNNSISTNLLHRPPVKERYILQHACPNRDEGYVTIELHDSLINKVTVRYLVNSSRDTTKNPAIFNDPFGPDWSGLPTFGMGPFELNVGNRYKFLLGYSDDTKKGCEHVIDNIQVQRLESITIAAPVTQNVECFGHSTGSVTLQVEKDPLHQKIGYKLERESPYDVDVNFNSVEDTIPVAGNNTTLTFNHLPYGNYHFSIQYLTINSCNATTTTFKIIQPDTLRFTSSTLTDVTCSTIHDGSIKVAVSGGSDTLRYQLFKLDTDVNPLIVKDYTQYKNLERDSLWFISVATFLTDSLSAGRYVVRIEDKCGTRFITDTFTINPVVPLQIHRNSWTTDSLTCWLDNTGSITVTATGGIDKYQWKLESITPDSLLYHYTQPASRESDNTTFDSQNLPANVYQIRLENQRRELPTVFHCPDFTVDTIEIKQHRKINISNHLQHIGCKEESTGQIDLKVVGGVPYSDGTYRYDWIGDNFWGNTITITNLKVGVYSVTVRDALFCPMRDTFELKEPPIKMNKTIAAVTQDVVCYGDSAIISQQPQFGWGQYNYLWESLDNNTIDGIHRELYVKDSMIYPTEPGRYRYSVIDSALNNSNICVSETDIFTVTLPSAPLYMHANKQTLPNGLDVTCRGVKDGFILFDFSGGNSTSKDKLYNVYKYEQYIINSQWLDGDELMLDTFAKPDAFTSSDYIPFIHYRKTNYQGGRWKLWVEDHRGCKTRDTIIELLTPASEIYFQLNQIVHNICYGDSVGKIAFEPLGGITPYQIQYHKDAELNWLKTFTFDSLRSEKHTFTLRDNVGCLTDTVVEIINLHRPITLTDNIFDVRCYNGNDGQYHFLPDGDFPFVQYLWNNTAIVDTAVKELKAGHYKLHITDNQNCQLIQNANIKQPEKLLLSTFSKPVCSNQPLGYITANVEGGIKPYSYRFANASVSQTDNLLYHVSGTYQVEVIDAHNCQIISEPTKILVNTIQPTPAFMVSTLNFLGDTLMLVEVSQPAPDSVVWDIDKSVESYMIGDIPHVILQHEGSATARMRAFYGGCDFMVEKNIEAYTNDSLVLDWRKGIVETIDPITAFIVSPNPSQGTLRIESTLTEALSSSVKIYDMQGQMVLEKNFQPQIHVNEHITLSASKIQNYYLFYFTQGGHRSVLIHVTP